METQEILSDKRILRKKNAAKGIYTLTSDYIQSIIIKNSGIGTKTDT